MKHQANTQKLLDSGATIRMAASILQVPEARVRRQLRNDSLSLTTTAFVKGKKNDYRKSNSGDAVLGLVCLIVFAIFGFLLYSITVEKNDAAAFLQCRIGEDMIGLVENTKKLYLLGHPKYAGKPASMEELNSVAVHQDKFGNTVPYPNQIQSLEADLKKFSPPATLMLGNYPLTDSKSGEFSTSVTASIVPFCPIRK
jgi:hypothetical protein